MALCIGSLLTGSCNNIPRGPTGTILVLPSSNSTFHQSIMRGVAAAVRGTKVNIAFHIPPTDTDYDYQREQLVAAAHNPSVAGIILTPNHSRRLFTALVQFSRTQKPFILVDRPLDAHVAPSDLQNYCGFVGSDNLLGGKLVATLIGRTLQRGNVVLIRGNMAHRSSQDREAGFMAELSRYPDLHVQHVIEGNWKADLAQNSLKHYIENGGTTIDAVFAYNDVMALAILTLFPRPTQRPLLVGFDGILPAQRSLLEGTLDATVAQAPYEMGEMAAQQLLRCMKDSGYRSINISTEVTLLRATTAIEAGSRIHHPLP